MQKIKELYPSEWCWMDIDKTKTVKCYDDNLIFCGWLYYGKTGLKILLINDKFED